MKSLRHIFTLLAAAVLVMTAACSRNDESDKVVGNTYFAAVSESLEFISGDKIAVKDAAKPFICNAEGKFVGDVLQSDEY